MDIITLDFETYFDKTYSLKSIPTSLYIKDPRYKSISCAFKLNNAHATFCLGHEEIKKYLSRIDWKTTAICCHHAQFDGLILAHHYGVYPAYYYDTLSMFRAKYGARSKASLLEACTLLDIDTKSDDIEFMKGVSEVTEEHLERLRAYNVNDVEITKTLFNKLFPFPYDELDLIDITIRMFTQPGFVIDTPRAQLEYEKEVGNKVKLMFLAGLTKDTLHSNALFSDWLRAKGVTPPIKWSEKQKKSVPALAKTDKPFIDLLNHPDELIRMGVEARLGTKSTGIETRALRFVTEGALGPLPVYLSYYGGHTGRWSGGNKNNLQNLKRGGELRKCLTAPPGFVIAVADSGQIECRINAWLSGQSSLLDLFRRYDAGDLSADPYKCMAAQIYSTSVESISKEQRLVGKVAVLGLGYQMGANKYKETLSAGGMGPPVYISQDTAYATIKIYRLINSEIVKMWQRCQLILHELTRKVVGQYKCLHWIDNKVYLPNGLYLEYPSIQENMINLETELTFRRQGVTINIYGGALLENIVQALARIIIGSQMLAIAKRYKILTMSHDEIVCLIPEAEATEGFKFMRDCMQTPPSWCSDLPLAAEGGFDVIYSK